MIKGINHQIIEVNDTGNIYYEKAILFIRPEYKDSDYSMLMNEASNIVRKYKAPSYVKPIKQISLNIIKLLISASIGSLLTLILVNLK